MATPATFTVALVQMRCAPDRDTNLRHAVEQIHVAAGQGAQIVCLPELFLGPYFCQREDARLFDLAEPIPGPSSEKLAQAARAAGVAVVGSVFRRGAAGG